MGYGKKGNRRKWMRRGWRVGEKRSRSCTREGSMKSERGAGLEADEKGMECCPE